MSFISCSHQILNRYRISDFRDRNLTKYSLEYIKKMKVLGKCQLRVLMKVAVIHFDQDVVTLQEMNDKQIDVTLVMPKG